MSYKSIMVQANATNESDNRLRLAKFVADLFEGTVIGVGAEALELPFALDLGYLNAEVVIQLRDNITRRAKEARTHFEQYCGCSEEGFSWIAEMGYPAQVMSQYARAADLIIANPAPHDWPSVIAKPSDLVMGAGVPVLLAPAEQTTLNAKNIVVAWKDTKESRRALRDALPFLKRAKNVVLLHVTEEPDVVAEGIYLRDVVKYLHLHDVKVEVEVTEKSDLSVAEHIDEACDRYSSDLVVAGAYGHSRMQEWMLGGVTKDLCNSFPKCVLFSH